MSTGSLDLIRSVLVYPWMIDANPVLPFGKGSAVIINVYRNKPERIEKVFYEDIGFDPKNTVYMGDNADEEPAFEYVTANGGRVVMPFLASEDFKQHCAEKYKAEVPEDERELRLLLK